MMNYFHLIRGPPMLYTAISINYNFQRKLNIRRARKNPAQKEKKKMSLFKRKFVFSLKFKALFFAAFTVGLLFSNAAAVATTMAYAPMAYGFAHKEEISSALCKDGDEYWIAAAINWTGEMADHWDTATWDGYIEGWEFCEYNSARPNCQDDLGNNLDAGDAALFATHGSWSGDGGLTNGSYSIKMATQSANYPNNTTCWAAVDYWLLDQGAEYVSSTSCISATMSSYMESYIKSKSKGLHQWQGYHGTTSTAVGAWTDNFADDAFDGPISWAWIDNMTEFDHYPGGSDVCAVSHIFGQNVDDCNYRRVTEGYSHFLVDPPDDGEEGIKHYFCGCDPPGPSEWTLPSC